jgi:hypothetical protein
MSLPRALAVALAVALAAPQAARAEFVITVFPSLGANIFGSPNYDAYRDNAITALRTGVSQAGTPGTPGYYQQVAAGSPILLTDLVVTDFNSWRGKADPGGAFAAETGTRLYFGLSIVSTTPGERFSIDQLSFEATSTDPFNTLDYSLPAGFYEYSRDYVGVRFGPNGPEFITSGPASQEVDALFGRGSSNAFEVLSTFPGATNQEKIDLAFDGVAGFRYTGTYSLNGVTGTATVDITAVPAPPGVVLLASGGLALLGRRLRRR